LLSCNQTNSDILQRQCWILFLLHLSYTDYDDQRCVQSGLCPDIITELDRFMYDGNTRRLTPVTLSGVQQRERWLKYSTLVAYVQPTLPDDSQHTSEGTSQLSIDDDAVSDGQSGSIQKPDEAAAASLLPQSVPQHDVSVCVRASVDC